MSSIKFYTDEHIDHVIADALRLHNIDVLTVVDVGKMSESDVEQLDFATKHQRVLVSRDQDYVILHHQGIHHSGIAYAHRTRTIGQIISGLILLHGVFEAEEMTNQLEYL
jgi:uncharacterized protein with PIN domain